MTFDGFQIWEHRILSLEIVNIVSCKHLFGEKKMKVGYLKHNHEEWLCYNDAYNDVA